MKDTNDAGFQLTLAEGGVPGTGESCWSCSWGCRAVLGKGGDPQGFGGQEEQAVFAHGVNGSGEAGAPRAAGQEWLRALALVGLALKVTRSWHDKPPHKCVLECSHHNLSSHGFVPVLKSRHRGGSTCVEGAGWGRYLPGINAALTHSEDDSKTDRIQG